MDLPSMETIVSLINEGIVSICNICTSLLDEGDPTTSSDYEQMRKHIEHAKECLKKSKTIEEKRKYLEQCIEQLTNEEVNVEQERARQNTGTGVTIGGAAVAAIPVIGWVPGIIMMAVGTSEIAKSSNAISDAQNERMKEIEEVKQNLQFTAQTEELVRSAANLLTVLSELVTAMERQTQSIIPWKPVKKALEGVMKAAENVAENRLVYSQNVSGLINTLRENVGNILALLSTKSCEQESG